MKGRAKGPGIDVKGLRWAGEKKKKKRKGGRRERERRGSVA
jgi:hypothetical protein